tara:strand:- start:36 stop:1064 length:1029 start_codon:yes stop_codon:yes gene_type:complete
MMTDTGNTTRVFISGDTADSTYFNGGNVGIGTASPSEKLHVHENLSTSNHQICARIGGHTSSYNTLVFGSKDGRPHIGGHRGDFQAWADLSLQNDLMVFRQSNMRVGIRGTSPQGDLHVSGGGYGTTNSVYNPGHAPPLYVTGNIGGQGTGAEFRHFNQTQGVGIGYASIYATGGNTNQELSIISRGSSYTYIKNYAAYSDDRLKTNEEYITNATDTLMKLKPQVYDKHEEINVILDNPIREAGLIAQDIYYDAPELRYLISARNKGIDAGPVNIPQERPFIDDDPTNDPDYSGWGTASAGVAYIQLVPYLIKSNQEIYTELQTEKAKVADLLARVEALENA